MYIDIRSLSGLQFTKTADFPDQASYNQGIESWHRKGIIPRQRCVVSATTFHGEFDCLHWGIHGSMKQDLSNRSNKHKMSIKKIVANLGISYTPVIRNLMVYNCFPFFPGNFYDVWVDCTNRGAIS